MLNILLTFYISMLLTQDTAPPENLHAVANAATFEETLSVTPQLEKMKEGKPEIQAESAVVMDLNTGETIWGKETKIRKPIASITKLMTALIVLEENNLNDIVTISQTASGIEGSKIWLYRGEKLTIRDLLYATIIHSANDAAYALAEFNSGNVLKFIEKMNQKAQKLGLYNTKFSNPMGFDEPENYSTAEDVALLGRYAYRNTFIRHAASISDKEIESIKGTKYKLENTNDLLKTDTRFKGLKTGHTTQAGYSFVGMGEINNVYPVLIVVLKSPNRFEESVKLLDWMTEHFKW